MMHSYKCSYNFDAHYVYVCSYFQLTHANFQTHEKRFQIKVLPNTDWKTTLTAHKCPVDDGIADVEQMPAMQPQQSLPVTEIGIRMPNIGRGYFFESIFIIYL